MSDQVRRELTTTEYVILGLLSSAPQTGYTIIHTLEMADSGWSASSGSIYPALRRLERLGVIQGDIEVTHATRLRKVYAITALGESALDSWLRSVPRVDLSNHDIPLIKFLFAERRLSRAEVLRWLDDYEHCMDAFEGTHRAWHSAQFGVSSVHQQLLLEATMMQWKMQRDWIQLARQRLLAAEPVSESEGEPEALAV